jgi:hypothetical protein
MSLEQAEAGLVHLIPRDIVMPVNPKYTAQEWSEIMAAQVPSPEDTTNLKKGTKPQPGNDLPHIFSLSLGRK